MYIKLHRITYVVQGHVLLRFLHWQQSRLDTGMIFCGTRLWIDRQRNRLKEVVWSLDQECTASVGHFTQSRTRRGPQSKRIHFFVKATPSWCRKKETYWWSLIEIFWDFYQFNAIHCSASWLQAHQFRVRCWLLRWVGPRQKPAAGRKRSRPVPRVVHPRSRRSKME